MSQWRLTTRDPVTLQCASKPGHTGTLASRRAIRRGGDVTDQRRARQGFQLEEATIDELHAAIRAGETTCVAVVQHYIDRCRAFNGVASMLVTQDGASVAEAIGTVRATQALRFPTDTAKASTLLPDLDQYAGPPLEF